MVSSVVCWLQGIAEAYLVLSKVAIVLRRWHPHGWVDWWGRGRAVWSACRSGVVLASTPTEANARVTDRITLHLVDGHLRGMALDELDEAAALSRGNLDVGDLAEALEERAELVLCHIARQAADEDSGVVGVGELIHGLLLLLLLAVVRLHRWAAHRWVSHRTALTSTLVHALHSRHSSAWSALDSFVLRCGS